MTAPITSAARRNVEAFGLTHAAILDGTSALTETDIYGVSNATLAPDLGSADNTGDDVTLSTWNWLNHANITIEAGYVGLDLYAKLSGTTVEVGGTPTAASVLFTPAASGGTAAGDSWDYTGPAATTFTVDGNTVALSTDLGDLAGTVAAIDTALPAAYTVTADGAQVRIARTSPGTYTIVVAGTNAVNITGSPNYVNTAGANASELSVPLWQEDAGNQPARPMLIRMPSRDALGNSLLLDVLLYKVQLGPLVPTGGPQFKSLLKATYSGKVLLSGFDEKGAAIAGKKRCGRLISKIAV